MDYSMLPPPSHDPARQYRIDHAGGRISKLAFQVSAGVLFAAAILSVLARFLIRILTRRRPTLDDYFVLIGAAALSAATGVLFHFLDALYLVEATNDFGLIPTTVEIGPILDMTKWSAVFVAMSWTSIFAIKCAFLAFFHSLIWQLSKRLNIYFWMVVVIITCCWLFLSLADFIICPYFGADAGAKCSDDFHHNTSLAINSLAAALDIICDLLIISIPIIVLSKSRMRFSQKIGLSAILCLSIVMIIIALIRIIGSVTQTHSSNKGLSPLWGIYWEIMEACVAVIMASVIVIRSVFIQSSAQETRFTPTISLLDRLRQQLSSLRRSRRSRKSSGSSTPENEESPQISNLKMTRGTLNGLRTFFGVSEKRKPDGKNSMGSTDTAYDLEEADYHNVRRQELKDAGTVPSS